MKVIRPGPPPSFFSCVNTSRSTFYGKLRFQPVLIQQGSDSEWIRATNAQCTFLAHAQPVCLLCIRKKKLLFKPPDSGAYGTICPGFAGTARQQLIG